MESNRSKVRIFKIKERHLKLGGKLALGLIILVTLIFVIFFVFGITDRNADWGAFGDYFGGVLNPLLSFMAFIALLYTIKIQQDALSITHDELELTRKELEKSTEALETQSDSLKLQNFETTFFNLFNIHTNLLSSIECDVFDLDSLIKSKSTTKRIVGKDTFNKIYELVISNCFEEHFETSEFPEVIVNADRYLIGAFDNDLSTFFNQVLNIFDLLNRGELIGCKSINTIDYINILKRQYQKPHMSLLLLFFGNYHLPEYHDLLKRTNFFHTLGPEHIPGLFDFLRYKYGSRDKKHILTFIKDITDEYSEKC